MIVTLTDATFTDRVLRGPGVVLVEFTAAWCPPCRMIEPVLRELAAEEADRLVVAQLDVDAHPAAARDAEVLGMPTLILYVEGVPVARTVGARPKAALLRMLEPHLRAHLPNSAC